MIVTPVLLICYPYNYPCELSVKVLLVPIEIIDLKLTSVTYDLYIIMGSLRKSLSRRGCKI